MKDDVGLDKSHPINCILQKRGGRWRACFCADSKCFKDRRIHAKEGKPAETQVGAIINAVQQWDKEGCWEKFYFGRKEAASKIAAAAFAAGWRAAKEEK